MDHRLLDRVQRTIQPLHDVPGDIQQDAQPEVQLEVQPEFVEEQSLKAGQEPDQGTHQTLDQATEALTQAMARAATLLNSCCDRVGNGQHAVSENASEAVHAVAFADTQSVELGSSKPVDLGPLTPLLEDPGINDILVNGPYDIYAERQGIMEKTDVHFSSHQELYETAERIVKAVGRQIDPQRPLVDARLVDGSRVNIITPPLALDGVSISIRKFSQDRITLDTMVEAGTLGGQLSGFLKAAAKAHVNIVISGGTGSGKTTLLNAVSQHIGTSERIVTIEDSAELQLQQPHVVRLETKIPSIRSKRDEEVSMRDLVKNALRMRPDRIIVGEVRGSEAFDMIQAMNTGHDGSLTTIHANTPRDGLARMENMIGMANLNIPTLAVRKQISSAVNLIVQTLRMEDGKRRIVEVSEVVGTEGDIVMMQEIFKFKVQGVAPDGEIQGKHVWSQVFPRHHGLTSLLRETGVFNVNM